MLADKSAKSQSGSAQPALGYKIQIAKILTNSAFQKTMKHYYKTD